MRFISSTAARSKLSDVLDVAQKECVVVTRQGEPAAIVIGVEGLDAEQIALGIDDELWLEVEQARSDGKYIGSAQMKRELTRAGKS